MKTTAADLEHRALLLPPDFTKYIVTRGINDARVRSFHSNTIHDVYIKPDGEGKLDVLCSCPAGTMGKVCHHITAYYAANKGITSMRTDKAAGKEDEAKQSPAEPLTGRQMIAQAIEILVDGIGLVVREKEE